MIPPSHDQRPEGLNRRQFLKRLGTVAVAVGAVSTAGPVTTGGFLGTGAEATSIDFTLPGRFGRMFPGLPPFAPTNDAIRAALMELGKPAGPLDAHDDLAAGPVAFIIDPDLSLNNPNHPTHTAGTTFFGMIFDPSQEGEADPDDLCGGTRAPRRFMGWQTFFDFGDGQVKPNKKIDTKISTPLFNLPLQTIPDDSPPTALPQRNLLRHLTWQLPSGQAIAIRMGAPVLSRADLAELQSIHQSFAISTPL
jgi:hypothetical protein